MFVIRKLPIIGKFAILTILILMHITLIYHKAPHSLGLGNIDFV